MTGAREIGKENKTFVETLEFHFVTQILKVHFKQKQGGLNVFTKSRATKYKLFINVLTP